MADMTKGAPPPSPQPPPAPGPGPMPGSGCCEEGPGEICCGWNCPCRNATVDPGAVRTKYVKIGEFNFDHVNGVRDVYVALDYAVDPRDGGWSCQPRVSIQKQDLPAP